MTFDEWMKARPNHWWRKALGQKFESCFEAGRLEGLREAEAGRDHEYRLTTPNVDLNPTRE